MSTLFQRLSEANLPEQIFWMDRMLLELKSRYKANAVLRGPSDPKWKEFRGQAVQAFPAVFTELPRLLKNLDIDEKASIYLAQFRKAKDPQAEIAITNDLFRLFTKDLPAEQRNRMLVSMLVGARNRTQWPGAERLEPRKVLFLKKQIEDTFSVRVVETEKSFRIDHDAS